MGFSWFVCKLCDSATFMKIFQDKADLDEHLRTEHVQIKDENSNIQNSKFNFQNSCSNSTIKDNENNDNKLRCATTVRLETLGTSKIVPKIQNLEERKPIVNPSQDIIDVHSSSTNNNFRVQDTVIVHENNKFIPSSSSLKNSFDDNKVRHEENETVRQKYKPSTSSSHSTSSSNTVDFQAQLEEDQATSSSPSTSAETIKLEKEKCYTCDICKKEYLYFNQFWRHLKSHDVKHLADDNPNCSNTAATENNLRFLAVRLKKLDLRQFVRQKIQNPSVKRKTLVNPFYVGDSNEIIVLDHRNQEESSKNNNNSQTQEISPSTQRDESNSSLPSTSKNGNKKKNNFKTQSNDTTTSDDDIKIISPSSSPVKNKLDSSFYCEQCKLEFLYFNQFWRHLKSHNLNASAKDDNEVEVTTVSNDSDSATTPVHLKQGTAPYTLSITRKMKHFESSSVEPSPPTNVRTPRLIRIPERMISYKSHQTKKNKCYTCTICQRSYKNIGSLRSHKTLNHANQLYSCKHCQQTFSVQKKLMDHVLAIHNSKDYYFSCDLCGKKIIRTSAMERHKRACISKKSNNHKNLDCHQESSLSSSDTFTNEKRLRPKIVLSHCKNGSDLPTTPESNYICGICGKAFKNWLNLESHKSLHKNGKIYKCPYCESKFISHSSLVLHIHQQHQINGSCVDSDKQLPNESPVDSRLTSGFPDDSSMDVGNKTHQKSKDRTCKVCGRTFQYPAFLRYHLKTKLSCAIGWNKLKVTTNVRSEKISVSNTGTNSNDEQLQLAEHTSVNNRTVHSFSQVKIIQPKLHLGENINKTSNNSSVIFSCNICSRVFKTKANLGCHLRIHKENNLTKAVPNNDFFQTQHVQERKCSNSVSPKKYLFVTKTKGCSEMLVKSSTPERKFSCKLCPRSFSGRGQLTNHFRSHKNKNINSNIFKTMSISSRNINHGHCITKTFSTAGRGRKSASKTQHIEKTRFSCSYCRKSCSSRNSLNIHTRLHTGHKPFGCKYCDNKYTSKGAAEVHMKIKHPRPFPCVLCKNAFITFDHLVKHNMKHHTEENIASSSPTELTEFINNNKTTLLNRNKFKMRRHNLQPIIAKKKVYSCTYCPKKLKTRDGFIMHTRTHTGERPHVCPYCERSFSELQYLNDHVRLHTGQKPYKCKICGKAYASRSTVWSHTKREHTKRHTGENL